MADQEQDYLAPVFGRLQAKGAWLGELLYPELAPERAEAESPAPEAVAEPSFDGGVREPVIESDPAQEHQETALDLLMSAPRGRGGEW